MWELKAPKPVKLIVGILAANRTCLDAAADALTEAFGALDLRSEVWVFESTTYYQEEMGTQILRQFVSVGELIDPGLLGPIKHATNAMERQFAAKAGLALPRPVNLDPGYVEPSKLVLATTKDYSHRVYIGGRMWAEVTLVYDKGWKALPYTFPDYREGRYFAFFDHVRRRVGEQIRAGDKGRRDIGEVRSEK